LRAFCFASALIRLIPVSAGVVLDSFAIWTFMARA